MLASLETLRLLSGTRNDLGLQLLLHVGHCLGFPWSSQRVGLGPNYLSIPNTCNRA